MYQDSTAPAAFFSSKAKTAWPFLIASTRSAGEVEREVAMASKAVEEGKASVLWVSWVF
jgi:hypothetical protein